MAKVKIQDYTLSCDLSEMEMDPDKVMQELDGAIANIRHEYPVDIISITKKGTRITVRVKWYFGSAFRDMYEYHIATNDVGGVDNYPYHDFRNHVMNYDFNQTLHDFIGVRVD